MPELKSFIEFMSPGTSSSVTWKEELNENTVLPDNIFGYRIYKIKDYVKETGKGNVVFQSDWIFFGRLLTLEEARITGNEILIWNMESNRIEYVVETKFGQMIPLRNNDIAIEMREDGIVKVGPYRTHIWNSREGR